MCICAYDIVIEYYNCIFTPSLRPVVSTRIEILDIILHSHSNLPNFAVLLVYVHLSFNF